MTFRLLPALALPLALLACTDPVALDGDADADAGSTMADEGQDDASDHSQLDTGGDGDGDGCNMAEINTVESCPALIGEGFCRESTSHVEEGSEIMWMNNPPHSGDHYPTWANWGEHEEPIPRGNWVHNLEHGGIVFVYNCPEDCSAELDVLRSVMDAHPDLSILMTADSLLDAPRFAAISWTWVLETDAPDFDELSCFVQQHYDNAPESVL